MILVPAVFGLLLLAAADTPAARPTAPARVPARAQARPGLSWAEADSFSRKIAVIEERHRQQKAKKSPPVQVTQGELNSYLNLSYADELP